VAQNATEAALALGDRYQGYGLGIFSDEAATCDEFIVYLEEVTIPGPGAEVSGEANHEHPSYEVFLVRDDGARTPIGSASPEACCGHAGEGDGPDDEPHEGRLVLSYIAPDGENLFARHSGVALALGGEVVFQDAVPPQSLPFLRRLLVESAALGAPGHAPVLKRRSKRLLALATEAATANETDVVRSSAEAMVDLLLGLDGEAGLYHTFKQILTQAKAAATAPGAKPALRLRLKEIQALYEQIEPQILELVRKTWSTAFGARTPAPARARHEAHVMLEAAQALARRMMEACGEEDVPAGIAHGFLRTVGRPGEKKETSRLVELYESELKHYRKNPEEAKAMATDPLGPLPEGLETAQMAALTVVANVLLNLDELMVNVRNALDTTSMRRELERLRRAWDRGEGDFTLVAESPAMRSEKGSTRPAAFSSRTLRTPCRTVVWSLPPHRRPISGRLATKPACSSACILRSAAILSVSVMSRKNQTVSAGLPFSLPTREI